MYPDSIHGLTDHHPLFHADNPQTVANLIALLSTLPADATVVFGMEGAMYQPGSDKVIASADGVVDALRFDLALTHDMSNMEGKPHVCFTLETTLSDIDTTSYD